MEFGHIWGQMEFLGRVKTGLSSSESTIVYIRGEQTFPIKGQIVNIFAFEDIQCL